MTNFEKWKEELTVEDCVAFFCVPCPSNCPVKTEHCRYSDDCEIKVREWANKECEDESVDD